MCNNIKCLLINLLLFAGVYCSWGCSCCADCCKKCCEKGDSKNEIENNMIRTNQLKQTFNIEIINENANGGNDGQKNLFFRTTGNFIKKDVLDKCLCSKWYEFYFLKQDGILVELEEQKKTQQNEDTKTLVFSKTGEGWKCSTNVESNNDLDTSKNRWAIFKVTTLKEDNNKEQEGDSHIFYCSDVSSIQIDGLFKEVHCYSIKILAANTKEVENFSCMFKKTKSSLEQDTKKQNKSGFIGLEKLDVSSAKFLSYMFYMALYKQKTVESLQYLNVKDKACITKMFCATAGDIDFTCLNKWLEGNNNKLRIYVSNVQETENVFFAERSDFNQNKVPNWFSRIEVIKLP